MDKIKCLLTEKALAIREAVEDYEEGQIYPANYITKVKILSDEMIDLLQNWDYDYWKNLDRDKKIPKPSLFKKPDTPISKEEKKDNWFKDEVNNWAQGFKAQIWNTKEPRQREIRLTETATKRMKEHNLKAEDIEDAFKYGEASKDDPNLIIRTYP